MGRTACTGPQCLYKGCTLTFSPLPNRVWTDIWTRVFRLWARSATAWGSCRSRRALSWTTHDVYRQTPIWICRCQ